MPGYCLVPLVRRGDILVGYAMVDATDYELVGRHRWLLSKGYARRYLAPGVAEMMSRVILGLPRDDPRMADHIDGNTLDNRRANLRVATSGQNQQNRRTNVNGTSRFRGVQWSKDKQRWRACAWLNRKRYHVGYFRLELDAARAVDAWRLENMPFAQPDPELRRLDAAA